MRGKRKILIIITGVLVVVIASAIILILTNIDSIIKAAIEQYGAEATKTAVRVSSVKIHLTSGEGAIAGLTVANPHGFSSPYVFRLGKIRARIDTRTITSNPIVIDEIRVAAPQVTYEINAAGASNISLLKQNLQALTAGKPKKTGEEKKNKGNIPYGFLSLFVLIFIPAVLLFGFLAKTGAYIPTVFIALFHFASWYVFYTKRLLKYPKDEQEIGIGKLFFGWRRNVRQLWLSIAILQLIFVGVVVLWRNSFAPNVTGLLVAPFWVPFWTIIHLTVSFLPAKPIIIKSGLPNLSIVTSKLRTNLPVRN